MIFKNEELRDTRDLFLKYQESGGIWLAQSVEHLTPAFGSGHDITGSWDRVPHQALY